MSIIQSALDRVKGREQSGMQQRVRSAVEPVAAPLINWPTASLPSVDLTFAQLQRKGIATSHADELGQREDYRYVRREVVEAMRVPRADGSLLGPIVVVTSAMPGDGKSYTALNLAISLAAENVRDVLLIDGDSVKCSLTRIFDLHESAGLVETMRDPSADLLRHTRATTLERLHVMPAGHRDGATPDLFSSDRADMVFGKLRETFQGHVVVVDAPPLLASSEAQLLANAADQVLLVVRAGVTLIDAVREAIGRVGSEVPVGVVLNAWEPMHESERRAYMAYEDYSKGA